MKFRPKVHTIRVFVNEKNLFGSPLGIIEDEKLQINTKQRQLIATRLNYSETVFIDDRKSGAINVFSPIRECPFSMYAALGAAWFIKNKLDYQINQLVSKEQKIRTFFRQGKTWVSSKIAILPQWNFVEYKTVSEIESFNVSEFLQEKHVLVWSWMDKPKGIIRARTFANDWGIPEDEANGSGAMRLASTLHRNISLIHGKGSVLDTSRINDNYVAVGGRCSFSEK